MGFFLLIMTLHSCSYFENKKVSSETIFEEHLQTFNWHEVDTYPKFSQCDSIIDNALVKQCFEQQFVTNINTFLANQQIQVATDVNDTIKLNIEINKTGFVTITSINLKPETRQQIPTIDSLLYQSIKKLPAIKPAKKHSQEVTAAFILPIVVKLK